ncbi:hypothetical protein [Streptomyces sp. NPDC127098]|uniref:hypothetical protein n=1 Tax=Streptomyces sp. NPDC127098 TaxID=3347137 RepID=UPI003668E239
MDAWGLLAGLIAYTLCSLVAARAAFAVQRSRLIAQEPLWHHGQDPVESFESHDRSSAATGAFLFGIAWPLTVPGYCVYRCATFVITARPRETDHERERRAQQLQRRIHELERSLDMPSLDERPHDPSVRRAVTTHVPSDGAQPRVTP